MLHLRTDDTIINKFRRFLGRISAETCLKWIILVVISKNRQALGAPSPDLHLGTMTREYARPYSQWTCLVYTHSRQFQGKTKLYIFCSPCPVK